MHRTGHKDSTQYPITLDYRRPSPVRGQLEPYDEKATKGWRYLQCTDTPNQLKVKEAVFFSQRHDLLIRFVSLGIAASQYSIDVRTTVEGGDRRAG